MLNIPFLQKKGDKNEGYLLLLFLAGEKVYGFAFEEGNPNNKSALYSESIDPFLKNAVSKIEKIISKCEADLGPEVYLQRTLLFLNSFYVSDSGGIREDFLTAIKKLFKDLDLTNLGYVNFYEAIAFYYGKSHKNYYFVEESVYDYTIYTFSGKQIIKTDKVAKSKDENTDAEEINRHLQKEHTIAFLYHKPDKHGIRVEELIQEENLDELLSAVYLKNRDEEETSESTDFPEAPGFIIDGDEDENKNLSKDNTLVTDKVVKEKILSRFKNFIGNIRFPQSNLWPMWVAFILLVLAAGYLFFLHKAEVKVSTKKENFSSKIEFIVGGTSGIGQKFSHNFSLKTSIDTSGEKTIGEKAEGEVTIYNGAFEKRDIATGSELIAKGELLFVPTENVTVPAATTSANLDAGVVTKVYGKKNVKVKAVSIGAEGNLDEGTKLLFEGFAEDELYALANSDFSGGFKKTVEVFSEEDKDKLKEKALELVKKEIKQVFNKEHGESSFLFLETLQTKSEKTNFSADIEEEVDQVELTYSGRAEVYFIPRTTLIEKVQKEKLTDKEFVEDSFNLQKIQLTRKNTGKYTYSAIVGGLVQRFIDKEKLLNSLRGKLIGATGEIIATERNIQNYQIDTKPIPLPLMPWNVRNIIFIFLD